MSIKKIIALNYQFLIEYILFERVIIAAIYFCDHPTPHLHPQPQEASHWSEGARLILISTAAAR